MMAFSTRFSYAFRCFFSLLFGGTIPPDIASVTGANVSKVPAAEKPKPRENPPVESFDRAVQMLALLQRDGRLIDFLYRRCFTVSGRPAWGGRTNHSRFLPAGA